MPEFGRDGIWSDDRLNDLNRRVANLELNRDTLTRLDTQSQDIRSDIAEAKQAISTLSEKLERDRESYRNQRKEDLKTSKSDRHWLIGTILASSTFIIGAVALIVSNI